MTFTRPITKQEMLDQVVHALVESKNEAADEVLLEALRLGSEKEKAISFGGLLRRRTVKGLTGVVDQYESLPENLQIDVLANIRQFHHALRECGRSEKQSLRLMGMRLIALGRQGKLAYVLSENLHESDETLSKAAVEAMVALARWVATETRSLQKGRDEGSGFGVQGSGKGEEGNRHGLLPSSPSSSSLNPEPSSSLSLRAEGRTLNPYEELIDNRGEIEATVARALDVHRGKHGQDLLRAALLLCDWPGSKTLAILQTTKHGGQSPMVRRLQQPPAAEHVEAFLLGASHGGLRSHFGIVFSHIDEAPVLDALLRRTHWLKDNQLQLCMHQVTRGTWWGDGELRHDIERRTSTDSVRIAEWLECSGTHDVMQDERMDVLRQHAKDDFAARLRLLRVAARRKRGTSVMLLKNFLTDPDERLVRMAAREIARRRPADFENVLLQLMTTAPESVRRIIGRAIGQEGFEHFWQRFDRLDKSTRKQAGRAMMKILPDAAQRLIRRLLNGPVEQRLKAIQITQELGLIDTCRDALMSLTTHPNAKVRSRAVTVVGDLASVPPNVLLERVLNDQDARVRSNAIEVLETKRKTEYVPLLATRARSAHNRERANAIKALHKMKVGTATPQLLAMLRDERSEHRISALWALRQVGVWQLLNEVARLAKEDGNVRVRRYALTVIRGVLEMAKKQKAAVGA
jgi:HEAT repeat protein